MYSHDIYRKKKSSQLENIFKQNSLKRKYCIQNFCTNSLSYLKIYKCLIRCVIFKIDIMCLNVGIIQAITGGTYLPKKEF